MAKIRLRFIQAFVDKKTGAPFHYFRRPGFARIRLPGMPGSTEFMEAYQQALGSSPEPIGAAAASPARSRPSSRAITARPSSRRWPRVHKLCGARCWNGSGASTVTR